MTEFRSSRDRQIVMPPRGFKSISFSEEFISWVLERPDYEGLGAANYIETKLRNISRWGEEDAIATELIMQKIQEMQQEALLDLIVFIVTRLKVNSESGRKELF